MNRRFSPVCPSRPSRRIFVAVAALSIAALAAPAAFAQAPGAPATADRNRIAPGTDLAALLKAPALIASSHSDYKDPATGEKRLEGAGEYHAILETPAEVLSGVVTDYAKQLKYYPRVMDSKLISGGDRAWVVEQNNGFKFLGIAIGYRTIFSAKRSDLAKGAIAVDAVMTESLDRKLADSRTSWYFEPVVVGGRKLTYARLYTMQIFRKPFLGMAGMVDDFTATEIRKMMEDTAAEALRRTGGAK